MDTLVTACSSSPKARSSFISESQSVVPFITEVVFSILCEVLGALIVAPLKTVVVCSLLCEVLGALVGLGLRSILALDCFNISGW